MVRRSISGRRRRLGRISATAARRSELLSATVAQNIGRFDAAQKADDVIAAAKPRACMR